MVVILCNGCDLRNARLSHLTVLYFLKFGLPSQKKMGLSTHDLPWDTKWQCKDWSHWSTHHLQLVFHLYLLYLQAYCQFCCWNLHPKSACCGTKHLSMLLYPQFYPGSIITIVILYNQRHHYQERQQMHLSNHECHSWYRDIILRLGCDSLVSSWFSMLLSFIQSSLENHHLV
jgi:hypothetical protein